MNQNRKGKSMLAAVMGSTYPFGMVQALSKQQPSHVFIDEIAAVREMAYVGIDYADSEARYFSVLGTDIGLEEIKMMHEARTTYKENKDRRPRGINYLSKEKRDSMSLDKWLQLATCYGFIGNVPRKFGEEAHRREVAAREWGWLASQRETRPAPEVD